MYMCSDNDLMKVFVAVLSQQNNNNKSLTKQLNMYTVYQ